MKWCFLRIKSWIEKDGVLVLAWNFGRMVQTYDELIIEGKCIHYTFLYSRFNPEKGWSGAFLQIKSWIEKDTVFVFTWNFGNLIYTYDELILEKSAPIGYPKWYVHTSGAFSSSKVYPTIICQLWGTQLLPIFLESVHHVCRSSSQSFKPMSTLYRSLLLI